MILGLAAFQTLALPVDLQPDQIPVHVVLAESEPVLAVAKEEVKALTVESKEMVEDKPVEPTPEPTTADALIAEPVVLEMVKTEDEEIVPVAEVKEDVQSEDKKTEEPVMILVEVPDNVSATTLAEVSTKTDDLEASVPEKKSEEPEKTSEDKDLETQSSHWGGWSAPVVAAPVVAAPWPAVTYHSGWAAPRTYSSYYYPTAHYSHSYWPSSYTSSYPSHQSAWW